MKKSNRILLGIATVWPFIYIALFMGSMFLSLFLTRGGASGGGAPEGRGLPIFFVLIFALHFLTILWIWALIAFYIYNVFKNDRVEKDKKVLWAVVLFMGNIMAMPVYWYLYIWRDDESPSSASDAPRALNNAEGYNPAAQVRPNQREKEYVPPTEPPNWRE
jgi:hypothetical protein